MENLITSVQNVSQEIVDGIYQNENTKLITLATVSAAIVAYMGIVRNMRYKNLNYIIKTYPDPQQALDDPEIAKEIAAITLKKEFPSFFKTFTIPSISKLLAATGEFSKACSRRIEDTQLILYEMLDTCGRINKQLEANPITPQQDIDDQCKREKEATDRLNTIHGKYTISNDDYIYTAALIVLEPIHWINRYEWRKLDIREINALYRVWYDVSITMNIENFPSSPEKLIEFTDSYAKENIKYSPSNWKCGENTARLIVTRFFPSFLHKIGYEMALRSLPSVLYPEDVAAFKLPYKESKLITWTFNGLLGLRAVLTRYFMLPRSEFVVRTPFYANAQGKYVPEFFMYKPYIYKDGYNISELGPEKFLKKKEEQQCPFACSEKKEG
ncbi:hypothetical protein EDC94DRAFT_509322 [Helicostylum pulchrum]|nr:hypothetical protein EDC94DRAFT_509322 [Helicostylum pulchrum]